MLGFITSFALHQGNIINQLGIKSKSFTFFLKLFWHDLCQDWINNLVCNLVGKILAIVPKKSEDCAKRSLNKLAKIPKLLKMFLATRKDAIFIRSTLSRWWQDIGADLKKVAQGDKIYGKAHKSKEVAALNSKSLIIEKAKVLKVVSWKKSTMCS